MAREVPSGTPTRSPKYIFPDSSRRMFRLSLAAGGVLLFVIGALYFVGLKQFASPGDLSTEHAPIDFRCAQCHATGSGRGIVDLRCERCHDPGGSDRLTNSAHVLFGSGDSSKADRAEVVNCVQCHTDHRSRSFKLRRVDDRECAGCHDFASLRRHPEFAVVKAKLTTGLGIRFDHDRHVVEARKVTGKPCEACHQPTPDLSGFDPISFDRHCTRCHVKDGFITGSSDPIAPDLLALPGQIAEPWADAVTVQIQPAARGRVSVGSMRHRDPWVIYNALRLRRAIDPEGELAERAAFGGQLSFLNQQLQAEPLSSLATTDLDRWAAVLQQEVASLDARLAIPEAPGDDGRAFQQMAAAIDSLATAAPVVDDQTARGLADEVRQAAPIRSTEDEPDAQIAARFDNRKQELVRVLDAIESRGDDSLKRRAQALRDRVKRLSAGGDRGTPDLVALRRGLTDLDEVFRLVRAVPDPEAALEAARINRLREFAQQRVAGGLSPEEFEERRRELLSALDTLDRIGNDALRPRVAELRQRALGLRPGTVGDTGLRRVREQKRKTLERIRLELELKAGGEIAAPAVSAPRRDRLAIESSIRMIQSQLAALPRGPRPGTPLDADQRASRITALESLLTPCLKCHELSGPRLAPVTAAEPVLVRSVFTHKPHVIQTSCESCHNSVNRSHYATDVNVPGVVKCQECHKPNQAKADCATCHVYHPPSVARLLRTL